MPKRKSLLKKTEVEQAKHARTCRHGGEKIPSGSVCLVLFDGPRERFCYSREVALLMIEDARQKLNELAAAFT
jgi:hypothetical protein